MDALQEGIAVAREGRQEEARALLQQALQADPRSEQGWLWMSAVVETDAERRTCLERVLTINPHNQTAQAGLERLSSAHGPGDGNERYLPISWTVLAGGGGGGRAAGAETSSDPVDTPLSPHSMPTLGMNPVVSNSRRIRRLAPQPEPEDGLAQLRAAQFHAPTSSSYPSSSESDPFMAWVLLGGLSITALAGALMLCVLWLVGWPP